MQLLVRISAAMSLPKKSFTPLQCMALHTIYMTTIAMKIPTDLWKFPRILIYFLLALCFVHVESSRNCSFDEVFRVEKNKKFLRMNARFFLYSKCNPMQL